MSGGTSARLRALQTAVNSVAGQTASLTADEAALIGLYDQATLLLMLSDPRYTSNRRVWKHWTPYRRLSWIYKMEEQAALGLPLAEAVVAAALTLRMTA